MYLRILVSIVSLCLLSCAGLPLRDGGAIVTRLGEEYHWSSEDFPITVLVDMGIRSEKRLAIREAALRWNKEVGRTVFVVREVDWWDEYLDNVPRGMIAFSQKDLGRGKVGEILGLATIRLMPFPEGVDGTIHSARIWISPSIAVSESYLVSVHELGHALGLAHDGDLNSVMFPQALYSMGRIMDEDILYVEEQMPMEWEEAGTCSADSCPMP